MYTAASSVLAELREDGGQSMTYLRYDAKLNAGRGALCGGEGVPLNKTFAPASDSSNLLMSDMEHLRGCEALLKASNI